MIGVRADVFKPSSREAEAGELDNVICRVSSRLARTTLKDHILKEQENKTKQKPQKKAETITCSMRREE